MTRGRTEGPSGSSHARAPDPFVKVPNAFLKRLSGRGKATAGAVQLVAWTEYRRMSTPGFIPTLAEAMKRPAKGGLGMNKDAFDAAMRVRVEAGLVERWQPELFAPAEEKPVAGRGKGFVRLDPQLVLHGPAKLVAFVAMVLLERKLVHPRHVAAGCLDVRDRKTVAALIQAALAGGHVAGGKTGGKWMVGRPPEVGKNSTTEVGKNSTTHKEKKIFPPEQAPRQPSHSKSLGGHPDPSSPPETLNEAAARELSLEEEKDSDDDARPDDGRHDGPLLREADRAEALARFLLIPGGLRGYCDLIDEDGDVARTAILAKLTQLSIDGVEIGKITSWNYFRAAIDEERQRAELVRLGIRPGDVGGTYRPKPEADWQAVDELHAVGPPDDWPLPDDVLENSEET